MNDTGDSNELDEALEAMRAIEPPAGPSAELAQATVRRMWQAAKAPTLLTGRIVFWGGLAAAAAAAAVLAFALRHEPATAPQRNIVVTPPPPGQTDVAKTPASLDRPLLVILEDADSYSILDVSTSVPIITVWPRHGMGFGWAVPLFPPSPPNAASQQAI